MESELLYMLGIVAVGFAVNYSLRALPFVLFAGKNRELPAWVTRLGNVISPIIIAGLIVYSYSGLEWKTAWPYLAGALTIALQLWKKNALVSIVAGTVLYMLLVSGCTTVREIEYGPNHPIIELSETGLKFAGQPTRAEDVPDLLEEYEIPKAAAIHIAVTPEVQRNLKPVRNFMAFLAVHGYHRSVLVTERHAESGLRKDQPVYRGASAAGKSQQRVIRYKGSNE